MKSRETRTVPKRKFWHWKDTKSIEAMERAAPAQGVDIPLSPSGSPPAEL